MPNCKFVLPHGQNVTFSRSLKQEDSPSSPRSHSSTSPSSCSSQPHSPAIQSQVLRTCLEQPQGGHIDFQRLSDLEQHTYIPGGDCLDSDLDQYFPSDNNHYLGNYQHQDYMKQHSSEEDDSNNNNHPHHRNKRLCTIDRTSQQQGDGGYETVSPSFERYHELQPSAAIKPERFAPPPSNSSTMYGYQSTTTVPITSSAAATYYANNSHPHQYLPSYQYLPQRTVFGNGSYSVDGNSETWSPYSM